MGDDMSRVETTEMVPGLVVHVDTTIIREMGGSLTTAGVVNGTDRAVRGPHYFILLEYNQADDAWLAAPLFSKAAAGSSPLNEALKTGLADKWVGQTSHYSAWQMWKMPSSAITAASEEDESNAQCRRLYADGRGDVLTVIARDREAGRNPYRQILN